VVLPQLTQGASHKGPQKAPQGNPTNSNPATKTIAVLTTFARSAKLIILKVIVIPDLAKNRLAIINY